MTHTVIPRYLPKRNENLSSHKNLYMNVCSSSIHNPPNCKQRKYSTGERISKSWSFLQWNTTV